MPASVELASPYAALCGLAGVVPVAVALVRMRTAGRLRSELGLAKPPLRTRLGRPVALACVFGLLGLAAAQPSIRRQHGRLTRSDAEVIVVLDSSRSMLAASGASEPPRYERAVAFAHRLAGELPRVPIGVASLTDRVLPYLFPTSDSRAVDLVLDKAYGIERPPPSPNIDPWVTTFEPLNEVTVRRFFSPEVHKRVLVVLSDAETHTFPAASVLHNLQRKDTTPVVVRFWRPDEHMFRPDGTHDSYRSTQPNALLNLNRVGWPTYTEDELDAAVKLIRRTIGSGPVRRVDFHRRETPVAPILALAALAPLLLLVAPGGRLPPLLRLVRRLRGTPAVART